MSSIDMNGTVTLFKGTGAKFSARLSVSMITEDIGRIVGADAGEISSTLIGRLLYLNNGVIYLQPENAFWSDDPSP